MKVAAVLFVSFVIFQSQINVATAKAIEDASDSSPEEEEEELTEEEEACVDELHLDKQLITELNNEEIAPEDNADFNAFLGCYWQKEAWMDANGEVKYDKISQSMIEMAQSDLVDEDAEFKEMLTKNIKDGVAYCESHPPTKGDTKGQTAVRVQNCIVSKLRELIGDVDLSSEEDDFVLSSKEENCVDELHLNKDRIIKLNAKEVAPENNDDFNKFLACYWMKEEWMDSHGDINFDNLMFSLRAMAAIAYQGETHELKSMMKKRIVRAVSYCQSNSSKGTSHGQTAAKLQNCITAKLSKGFYYI